MKQSQDPVETVAAEDVESTAIVIKHVVLPRNHEVYELWLRKMTDAAIAFDGRHSIHIIKPVPGQTEYTIVLRYESFLAAEKWIHSEIRKCFLAELPGIVEIAHPHEIHPGIEFWFSPLTAETKQPKPWKQWLVTSSVIWPLTTLVPLALKPLFKSSPVFEYLVLRQGLVSFVVVALVVFLIMPRYVRAIAGWLYK